MKTVNILNKSKTESINPLFTIITVVYNGEKSITKTINSVLKQTYGNFEYIIIDGNSTDNTNIIISNFKDSLTNFISENDLGIYDAMNKGIRLAKGEWVNFMNSGDVFNDENVLYNISKFIEKDPLNLDIIYGNHILNFNDSLIKIKPMNLNRLNYEMAFCHQSTFIKNDILKSNYFNLKYKYASDFDMMNKLYLKKMNFKYIDHDICIFDQTEGATLKNYKESIKERFLIIQNINPFLKFILLQKSLFRMRFGLFRKRILPDKLYSLFFKRKFKNKFI
jgi:glycosyltransferase involved in cell wall biosynthesis